MPDTVDQETRSRIMASVRQRNTRPEMKLRRALHHLGLRYRLHNRKLPGTPDLAFPRFKAVIFVHGCFWHSHGCKFSTIPATRREFWVQKFEANRERDKRKIEQLQDIGWRVLVVWECALKTKPGRQTVESVVDLIAEWLNGSEQLGEIGSVPVQSEECLKSPV